MRESQKNRKHETEREKNMKKRIEKDRKKAIKGLRCLEKKRATNGEKKDFEVVLPRYLVKDWKKKKTELDRQSQFQISYSFLSLSCGKAARSDRIRLRDGNGKREEN